MTDLPYTDADLRAEAARQYYTLTEDPDYMGVGEMMEDRYIGSTVTDPDARIERTGSTWGEALPYNHDGDNAFNAAQRKVYDLICKAADVSDWAIDLGADGLQPSDGSLSMSSGDKPIARILFAFEPDMPAEMREALIRGVGEEIARYV